MKLLLVVSVPSLTLRVTAELPFWSGAGVTVTERDESLPDRVSPLAGIKAELDAIAETCRLVAGVSRSATEKGIGPVEVPCAMVRSAMDEIEGGSLIDCTTTLKLRLMVLFSDCPSSTVTVITAVPDILAAGVKLSVPEVLGLT